MRRGLALALLLLAAPSAASAQEERPDSMPPIPTELESLEGRPSARGAMLRSFVLPGWGQASYDRWVRAGVYFSGHVGNGYMIYKTLTRLDEAQDREDKWVDFVGDSIEAAGEVPADSIAFYVDADARVRHARNLVASREEQREDWIALGVFWVLISGVDAYVTAQLADFPASIGAIIDDRRIGVIVTVPVR